MKKVLFVIMHLEMGGAEKSLVNLLNELSPKDFDVDLLLIKRRGILMKQVPDWVNIIDAPYELSCLFGGSIRNVKGITLAVLRLWGSLCTKVCKKRKQRYYWRWKNYYSNAIPKLDQKYDVAVSYLSGESMYYVAEKVSADKKVCWIHTDLIACGVYEKEFHHYFGYFDRIATISNECVDSICRLCPEAAEKVRYLPNIVSGNLIKAKAEAEKAPQTPEGVFSIVSVGRLEHVKGFDMAIRAAAILKEKQTDFYWRIIGDGSEQENLEKLIAEHGLENHVVLEGLKENPYPYVKDSDLVVQTSRFEGKSIVLDEAKILGVPILATNYATVRDQVSPNEGWVVGMSPEEIAEGILYVIRNPEEHRNVKAYLQEQRYGNVDVVKDYLKCLGV